MRRISQAEKSYAENVSYKQCSFLLRPSRSFYQCRSPHLYYLEYLMRKRVKYNRILSYTTSLFPIFPIRFRGFTEAGPASECHLMRGKHQHPAGNLSPEMCRADCQSRDLPSLPHQVTLVALLPSSHATGRRRRSGQPHQPPIKLEWQGTYSCLEKRIALRWVTRYLRISTFTNSLRMGYIVFAAFYLNTWLQVESTHYLRPSPQRSS